MAAGIFINYRGADSCSYAALLYRELSALFGQDQVFLDSESIPAGTDFAVELLAGVRASRVLLAVIGRSWLTGGLDDPEDWIRREIAEAFSVGVVVVPILVDEACLPSAAQLPADIRRLARCQFRRLRHRDAAADLARIAADLAAMDPRWSGAGGPRGEIPRTLPAPPPLFVGRRDALRRLDRALLETRVAAAHGYGPTITVVGGAGGMGKTWLVTYWAHQHLAEFADGQLFVNLRGFDPSGEPARAYDVLRVFLIALGMPPEKVPDEREARLAAYRSRTAGKRLLIVLDNAADTEQVESLLPGGCAGVVLITTRRRLAGLTTRHGARPLDIDVLDAAEAHEVLVRTIGADRLATERSALSDLQRWCAGLPLALGIVAARAAIHPGFPLAALTEELRDHAGRLDALDAGESDTNLRSILSWSYHALSRNAARLFGLLGLAYGADITQQAAARLNGAPVERTRVVLAELESAHLIQQHQVRRYRMHDLVRLYAAEQARADLPDSCQEAALRRLTDHYLTCAEAANNVLYNSSASGRYY